MKVEDAIKDFKKRIERIKAWEQAMTHKNGCPLAPYDPLSLQETYTTSTKCICEDLVIGEVVDETITTLREVGIVIEGSQAHLAHAILRSAMAKAVVQVRAEKRNDLENNKET